MKYIIVCGPTGSGKTSLGIQIALRYNGEVINADSRQIYKHTNIGTAKPTPDECLRVKHHLIDILELHEKFSAFRFASLAKDLINDITDRNKLPIIVGGTGLYLKAITEGLFKAPEPDEEYRRELEQICQQDGPEKLHRMLAVIDPASAEKINPRHSSRLIRAIEIYKLTGKPISEIQKNGDYRKTGKPLWLGLMPARDILYNRINKRVDDMIDAGFEQEVLNLKPFLDVLRKKKMVGYNDMISYLFDKNIDKDQTINKIKQRHRNYAKRQITWFRKVKNIRWFDPTKKDYANIIYKICDKYLKKT